MGVKQRELLFTLVHVSDLSWMQPYGLGLAEDLGWLPSKQTKEKKLLQPVAFKKPAHWGMDSIL